MSYISVIEDRLSMDDVCARGQEVEFEISESFLRSNDMERLNVLEKMLNLNLITIDQARQMEDLAPTEGAGVTDL